MNCNQPDGYGVGGTESSFRRDPCASFVDFVALHLLNSLVAGEPHIIRKLIEVQIVIRCTPYTLYLLLRTLRNMTKED
jgi:hypothetical protein